MLAAACPNLPCHHNPIAIPLDFDLTPRLRGPVPIGLPFSDGSDDPRHLALLLHRPRDWRKSRVRPIWHLESPPRHYPERAPRFLGRVLQALVGASRAHIDRHPRRLCPIHGDSARRGIVILRLNQLPPKTCRARRGKSASGCSGRPAFTCTLPSRERATRRGGGRAAARRSSTCGPRRRLALELGVHLELDHAAAGLRLEQVRLDSDPVEDAVVPDHALPAAGKGAAP